MYSEAHHNQFTKVSLTYSGFGRLSPARIRTPSPERVKGRDHLIPTTPASPASFSRSRSLLVMPGGIIHDNTPLIYLGKAFGGDLLMHEIKPPFSPVQRHSRLGRAAHSDSTSTGTWDLLACLTRTSHHVVKPVPHVISSLFHPQRLGFSVVPA